MQLAANMYAAKPLNLACRICFSCAAPLYIVSIPTELPKPLNSEDFERMCVEVYARVFKATLPARNGRRGQKQEGVDAYFEDAHGILYAVQSKCYNNGGLTQAHIDEEVRKLDAGGEPVAMLVVATTAPNDARLASTVRALSAERAAKGLCRVSIDFWDEVVAHIRRDSELRARYELNSDESLLRKAELARIEDRHAAERRHAEMKVMFARLEELMQDTAQQKAIPEPAEEPAAESGPKELTKAVTDRFALIHLTFDLLAVAMLERQRHLKYERRVTFESREGTLFLDALRQDDNLEADEIVEVRWLRKAYMDGPVWAQQVASKVSLYEAMTGRHAKGTLVFVVPPRLSKLEDLPYSNQAVADTAPKVDVVMMTYEMVGFEPGGISGSTMQSDPLWRAVAQRPV